MEIIGKLIKSWCLVQVMGLITQLSKISYDSISGDLRTGRLVWRLINAIIVSVLMELFTLLTKRVVN